MIIMNNFAGLACLLECCSTAALYDQLFQTSKFNLAKVNSKNSFQFIPVIKLINFIKQMDFRSRSNHIRVFFFLFTILFIIISTSLVGAAKRPLHGEQWLKKTFSTY